MQKTKRLTGYGILDKISETGDHAVIITDSRLNVAYKRQLERILNKNFKKVDLLNIKAGEQSKNIHSYQELTQQLLKLEADRSVTIFALGGGMVCDLAGFVAATYMRGVRLVQVPTSLLAMVDASVGSKNAIDHPLGKNLMGTFYDPIAIYADIDFLKTLPKKQFSNGMAEIIKIALISDKKLFKTLRKKDLANEKILEKVMKRAVNLKEKIVAKDFKDEGVRKILNFGHTIGHALETYLGYKKLSHGQAVAIGMMQELTWANPALKDDVKNLLDKFSLPSDFPKNLNQKKLWELVQHDKKNKNGEMMMASIPKIGKAKLKRFKLNDLKKMFEVSK